MPETDPIAQQEAQQILRRHNIEIDLSDFRTAQEIVCDLGLQAMVGVMTHEIPDFSQSVRKEDKIDRREGHTYFA